MKAQAIKQDQKTAGRKAAATAPRLHAITPLSSPPQAQRQPCACGGGCPRCQDKPQDKPRLQAKLAVSQPNDIYEQEADRVAEQVMRMPAPSLPRTSGSGTTHGTPAPTGEQEEQGLVQRKVEPAPDTTAASVPDSFLQSLGPGQPLDRVTRTFFEPRFGSDFSQVRVHTDTRAAESARTVNALAYTVGRNVVFGAEQYAPGTSTGNRLLAHELTHVVQQGKDAANGSGFYRHADLRIGPVDDVLEREADAATMISDNVSVPVRHLLQRAPFNSDDPRDMGRRSTLPYREATELVECIRIMGEENRAYCRQEVLGEQPQPTLESDKEKKPTPAAKPAKKPAPSTKPAKKPSTKGVARQAECGEKCGGTELGSVECDLNLETGLPTDKVRKEIRDKDPCTSPCVDVHETVHVKDIEPICKQVHECLNKAGDDTTKQDKCLDTYEANSWAKVAGSAGTECAAYKAEEQCMKKRESVSECKTKEGQSRWTAHLSRTKCYKDCYCSK